MQTEPMQGYREYAMKLRLDISKNGTHTLQTQNISYISQQNLT